jgi:hypothetical protein
MQIQNLNTTGAQIQFTSTGSTYAVIHVPNSFRWEVFVDEVRMDISEFGPFLLIKLLSDPEQIVILYAAPWYEKWMTAILWISAFAFFFGSVIVTCVSKRYPTEVSQ